MDDTLSEFRRIIDNEVRHKKLESSTRCGRQAFAEGRTKSDLLIIANGDAEILMGLEKGFQFAADFKHIERAAAQELTGKNGRNAAARLDQMMSDLEEDKMTLEGTRALRDVSELKLVVTLLADRIQYIERQLGFTEVSGATRGPCAASNEASPRPRVDSGHELDQGSSNGI